MTLSTCELETELRTLLSLVRRLMPALNHKPHLFHEQKSALEHAVKALIARAGAGVAASPRAFTTPVADDGAAAVSVGNRRIPIVRRGRVGAKPAVCGPFAGTPADRPGVR